MLVFEFTKGRGHVCFTAIFPTPSTDSPACRRISINSQEKRGKGRERKRKQREGKERKMEGMKDRREVRSEVGR